VTGHLSGTDTRRKGVIAQERWPRSYLTATPSQRYTPTAPRRTAASPSSHLSLRLVRASQKHENRPEAGRIKQAERQGEAERQAPTSREIQSFQVMPIRRNNTDKSAAARA